MNVAGTLLQNLLPRAFAGGVELGDRVVTVATTPRIVVGRRAAAV